MQQETMRGSLFPLFPLRLKCQNHERVPISPISPILVANVYSSCQDMDHQNRGNRGPLSVFPWWSAKTMRGSRENTERAPISPKGEVPKPWEGPYFPYFQGLSFHLAKTWTTKIGEIGTLSWFWHFTLKGERGNRDPLSVFPWWSAKTMKGSLFPIFWWPMSIHPVKTWTTKIREIGEIGTLSWFWHFTLRGNRGNRDPLSVFPWWSAPISPILVAHVLTRWQGMDHPHGFGTSPLGAIGEIETLSWFWKKADMCVDMCWHSLEIGWFMLQMWWLPWMKTCMIKNVFGIYGYWVNKCNYPQTYKYN